jgi:hypothetical protein
MEEYMEEEVERREEASDLALAPPAVEEDC